MEVLMSSFGDRLKTLRDAAGMSQEALARAANISTSAITKIEQKRTEPGWPTVLALAAALGVEVTAFLGEDDEPPRPPKKRGKK
jgi:transcriptional regulator with XRE-family HTH domain